VNSIEEQRLESDKKKNRRIRYIDCSPSLTAAINSRVRTQKIVCANRWYKTNAAYLEVLAREHISQQDQKALQAPFDPEDATLITVVRGIDVPPTLPLSEETNDPGKRIQDRTRYTAATLTALAYFSAAGMRANEGDRGRVDQPVAAKLETLETESSVGAQRLPQHTDEHYLGNSNKTPERPGVPEAIGLLGINTDDTSTRFWDSGIDARALSPEAQSALEKEDFEALPGPASMGQKPSNIKILHRDGKYEWLQYFGDPARLKAHTAEGGKALKELRTLLLGRSPDAELPLATGEFAVSCNGGPGSTLHDRTPVKNPLERYLIRIIGYRSPQSSDMPNQSDPAVEQQGPSNSPQATENRDGQEMKRTDMFGMSTSPVVRTSTSDSRASATAGLVNESGTLKIDSPNMRNSSFSSNSARTMGR
jgi:hypothetical protein